MKPECWTAVRGDSGRDFSKISPKPAPLSVLSWEGGVARGVRTVECIVLVKLINVKFVLLTCRKEQIMKHECWTAVRGASWRDISKISPKPAPLSVLSWEGGVAPCLRTVECIVAS